MKNWRKYFTEAKPRKIQEEVLDFIASNWDDYDNFILDLPTGIGKSAIAVCLAKTLSKNKKHTLIKKENHQKNRTYITTTTIELQNQYERCYSTKGLKKIYSSDHYLCCKGGGLTCADGGRLNKHQKKSCPNMCEYLYQKREFINGEFGVSNLAYYINETSYAGEIPTRDLIIFDEAHTVGETIKSFVSLDISTNKLEKYNIENPPVKEDGSFQYEELKRWLDKKLFATLKLEETKINNKIKKWKGNILDEKFISLTKESTKIDKYMCKINRVINSFKPNSWVVDFDQNGYVLTPISPKDFIGEVLINKNIKRIFMSATMLNKDFVINEYDLDTKKTTFYSAKSPFDKDNRKIYYMPTGRIKHDNISSSIEKFKPVCEMILEEHKNERGIIFLSSYKQVYEFVKLMDNDRLIYHIDSKTKETMMDEHLNNKDTVIVSPSMHEGVDLKNDLSRFQIIMKIPFMSLGSNSVKKRMEIDKTWYAYRTIMTLIQATGRSIRSENDKASTYILDDNFGWFFKTWNSFFPDWWKKAIIR